MDAGPKRRPDAGQASLPHSGACYESVEATLSHSSVLYTEVRNDVLGNAAGELTAAPGNMAGSLLVQWGIAGTASTAIQVLI